MLHSCRRNDDDSFQRVVKRQESAACELSVTLRLDECNMHQKRRLYLFHGIGIQKIAKHNKRKASVNISVYLTYIKPPYLSRYLKIVEIKPLMNSGCLSNY
jgi:hypothetical protein